MTSEPASPSLPLVAGLRSALGVDHCVSRPGSENGGKSPPWLWGCEGRARPTVEGERGKTRGPSVKKGEGRALTLLSRGPNGPTSPRSWSPGWAQLLHRPPSRQEWPQLRHVTVAFLLPKRPATNPTGPMSRPPAAALPRPKPFLPPAYCSISQPRVKSCA